MYRISSRSVLLRALLCALVLLLGLAPITGAAAATPALPEQAEGPDESATETVAATEDATVTAAPSGGETATESAEVTATQEAPTQLEAAATAGSGTTTQDGPYTPDPNASPAPSGNGTGNTPHPAGSKGNADGKNPPGQMPGPDDDGDSGYECDGNQGASKGNPAHTQCPPPTIKLVKSAGPVATCPAAGQGLTYTFTITNTGRRTLQNVTLNDPMLGGAITLSKTTLAPGEVLTATATYALTAANVAARSVTNTATVRGAALSGETATDTATAVKALECPAISLTKSAAPVPECPGVGQQVTYTFTITNTGKEALRDVALNDPMLGGAITLSKTTLAADEVLTATATYPLTAANVAAGSVNNTATVTGANASGKTVSHTAQALVDWDCPSGILITKQHTLTPFVDEQTVERGGTATWVLQVTNTSQSQLTNVTVTDPLAPDCNRSLGTLAAGQSAPVYGCSLADVQKGFTNTANVVGTTPSGGQVTASDTALVGLIPPGNPLISLVKTASAVPACPGVGQLVTYTFRITNGPQALSNVALNDPMLGGAITLSKTTLGPDEVLTATATYALTAANLAAGRVKNTATVTGETAAGQTATNTARATVLLDCPDIKLDKTGRKQAQVGEQIPYTFKVTNTGSVTLTNVRIDDERLGIQGLLVNPSTLAPGESGTATATYLVTEADADARKIVNIAVARGRTPDGTDISTTDRHRTIIKVPRGPRIPKIRLLKSGPTTAKVGDKITYTFRVKNVGKTPLLDVNIDDVLLGLSGLTVRPSTLQPGEWGTATATDAYTITRADQIAGSVYNTAVAKGTAPSGREVQDDDDHKVTVPKPPCIGDDCDPDEGCMTPPCRRLPETGLGTTGFALTALLSLALGGVLLGIAGSGNLQTAMANNTVNADSPMLAMLRRWNLAPKPGGSQVRRRRRR